jgi:O-methyltransferase
MDSTTIPRPTAPPQHYGVLRRLLPKHLQPWVRALRRRLSGGGRRLPEPYRSVYPFATASLWRQRNLFYLAETIDREEIPGAMVECGVLDGGTAALMALGAATSGRDIHLFDAWQGLPLTTSADGAASDIWTGQAVGSPRRVHAVMRTLAIPASRVHFHHGWFHETFPKADVPRVALLHIDCDFYEPTRLCLERWYPYVVPGGWIQFDDYSEFEGAYRAVNEFLADHPELSLKEFGQFGGQAYYLRVTR